MEKGGIVPHAVVPDRGLGKEGLGGFPILVEEVGQELGPGVGGHDEDEFLSERALVERSEQAMGGCQVVTRHQLTDDGALLCGGGFRRRE